MFRVVIMNQWQGQALRFADTKLQVLLLILAEAFVIKNSPKMTLRECTGKHQQPFTSICLLCEMQNSHLKVCVLPDVSTWFVLPWGHFFLLFTVPLVGSPLFFKAL
jgi:hypothetical protein